MNRGLPSVPRPDPRRALRHDLARHARREVGHQTFWRSIGMLGMVGWPIALCAVGGAMLGRYLDHHWATGIRFTLMLLLIGIVAGSLMAWRTVRHHGEPDK